MWKASKKNLLVMSLFTLLTTGLPGLFFNSVYATSDFDDLVQPISHLTVSASGGDIQVDHSEYMGVITRVCPASGVDIFLDRVSEGRNFAILQESAEDGSSFKVVFQNNNTGDFTGQWVSPSSTYPDGELKFSPTGGAEYGHMFVYWDYSSQDFDCFYQGPFFNYSFHMASYTPVPGYLTSVQPLISTFDSFSYPTGYEGSYIKDGSTDGDGDGLTLIQESRQGTSDVDMDGDTDNDGISDLDESIWYTGRDIVYCGIAACAYPNPKKKDIFVEVDWMEKSSTPLVPTTTQLEAVENAFNAQGINIHFDTGIYGGGGQVPYEEELNFSPSTTEVDFYNYKNGGDGIPSGGYFSEYRKGIWRYMVSGDGMPGGNSGVARVGSDSLFIAYDGLKHSDTAVSGTIMHELGHALCLSPEPPSPATVWYTDQDPSCIFEGVHSEDHDDYDSSMNYDKQKTMVDFSDGSNGAGDHNDWAAVMFGINDFVELRYADPEEPSEFSRSSQTQSFQIIDDLLWEPINEK